MPENVEEGEEMQLLKSIHAPRRSAVLDERKHKKKNIEHYTEYASGSYQCHHYVTYPRKNMGIKQENCEYRNNSTNMLTSPDNIYAIHNCIARDHMEQRYEGGYLSTCQIRAKGRCTLGL